MATTTYDIGDTSRVRSTFTQDGVALSPSTVTLTIDKPDGTSSSYTGVALTQDATGQYHVDIDIDQEGTWRYRWVSTGTGKAAEEGSFYVRPQQVT